MTGGWKNTFPDAKNAKLAGQRPIPLSLQHAGEASVGTRVDSFQATAWGGLGPWWASPVALHLHSCMSHSARDVSEARRDAHKGPRHPRTSSRVPTHGRVLPYHPLLGLVALLCITLVLFTACSSTPQTTNKSKNQSISTTDNGVITYSDSPQDVLIRTFYGGGKLGSFEYSPEISIYGDGTYILGPGLDMREGQMSSNALQQLLQTLVGSDGLLKFTTKQFYDTPDQNATFLQLMLNGTSYTFQYGPFGNLQESAQDMNAYHRLGAALTSIINAVNSPTHPYSSTQMALLVHQDFNPDQPQNIPIWSLPDFNLYNLSVYECGATPVDQTGPNGDSGCLTYTVPRNALLLNRQQQQAILSLLKGQQQGVFSEQGSYYTVTLRPLLPDEAAKKMLAMLGSAELDYAGVPLQTGPVPIATPAG